VQAVGADTSHIEDFIQRAEILAKVAGPQDVASAAPKKKKTRSAKRPKGAMLESTDQAAKQASMDFASNNQAFLKDFLRTIDEPVILKVPIESLKGLTQKDILDWLGTLNNSPSVYIELYSAQRPDEVLDSASYGQYGLIDLLNKQNDYQSQTGKSLKEIKSQKNTITLFIPKDEWKDSDQMRSDLQIQDLLQNTILVPVAQANDPTGIIRGTVFGMRLIEIARQPDIEQQFITDTYDQYKNLLESQGNKDIPLTIDDIKALASGDFNELVKALRRLIDSLPKPVRISPEDIRDIFERARSVLEAA